MMEYKGYVARVEFDDESGVFYGEILNLRDVVTFEGQTVDDLRQAFRASVDDYLDFCASRKELPEKPYSGRFVVRVNPNLHKSIARCAMMNHKSVNAWVQEILEHAAR